MLTKIKKYINQQTKNSQWWLIVYSYENKYYKKIWNNKKIYKHLNSRTLVFGILCISSGCCELLCFYRKWFRRKSICTYIMCNFLYGVRTLPSLRNNFMWRLFKVYEKIVHSLDCRYKNTSTIIYIYISYFKKVFYVIQ